MKGSKTYPYFSDVHKERMDRSCMSSEETESKEIPTNLPRLRIVRGVLLWYAAFVFSSIFIWYPGFYIAFYIISLSFVFGIYELYYGAKFYRKPTSNILSFESNAILVLSFLTENLAFMIFLTTSSLVSIPQVFLALALIHFTLYMSSFLLEVRILYSEYLSRPKKVPEFIDSYIPERYR
jgi:hypothetical protein